MVDTDFLHFLKSMTVEKVLQLYSLGVISRADHLKDAATYLSYKTEVCGEKLNDDARRLYYKLIGSAVGFPSVNNGRLTGCTVERGVGGGSDDVVIISDDEDAEMETVVIRDLEPTSNQYGGGFNKPEEQTGQGVEGKLSENVESKLPPKKRFTRKFETAVRDQVIAGPSNAEPVETRRENVASDVNEFRFVSVLSEGEATIKKFGLTSRRVQFTFKDVREDMQPLEWLKKAINEVLEHSLRSFTADHLIGLVLENEDYANKPVYVSFRKLHQLNVDIVMDKIAAIFQSNQTFFTNNKMTLRTDAILVPVGRGYSALDSKCVSFSEYSTAKTSIFAISNDDNRCLAYALVVAMKFVGLNHDKRALKNFFAKAKGKTFLREKGLALCLDAGVNLENGATFEDVQKFQQHLKDYVIVIFAGRKGKSIYFHGDRTLSKPRLNLVMEENHFNVILSLTGAFSFSYFCEYCLKGYRCNTRHQGCQFKCPCCQSQPPCEKNVENLLCAKCNRRFRGAACLEMHRQNNTCAKWVNCKVCGKTYLVQKRPHECGVEYCSTCGAYKKIRHMCYMKPDKLSESKEGDAKMFLFIFFDLETRQDKQISENLAVHEANLCVAQQTCASCVGESKIKGPCKSCGLREKIFLESDSNGNVVKQFLQYVSEMSKRFKVTVIAHNLKGFDGCFIIREMMKECNRWNPDIIRAGMKIMTITCGDSVRFIDSLNFIQQPLAAFPKAFGFEGSKGYFPHFFNSVANKNYIGPMPDKQFYGYDTMSSSARKAFVQWHDNEVAQGSVFNMASEIIKYCRQDVEILRLGCLKFRECFITENNVDPLLETITIASACNLTFRRNFLKAGTIGIVPRHGYRKADRQSFAALCWLRWIAEQNNVDIKHAGNSREIRLKENILVDGYCAETNTVYEFHGCFWHGCQKCFVTQDAELGANSKDTLFARYESTMRKQERITSSGYRLVVIWECEFNREIKTNDALRCFVEKERSQTVTPLNPRDAFFGGRTNASKLYHLCEQGEQIRYYDVCSLYPFINKYGKYPVGHPVKIYSGDECKNVDLSTIEGLIKCTVLPPQNLYHPVLPYRCNGKLMFPLCRTCAETMALNECGHGVKDRQFLGTYVADELRKGVELGYTVVNVHEIWEYETLTYGKEAKTDGLFSAYVNNFLKIKQECSGWPSWCNSDVDRKKYIDSYRQHEGVELNPEKVCKNPGLRLLSKTMLNSFWGKFGQRENNQKTDIIHNPYDLFKLSTDPGVVVKDITIINPDVVLATSERVEEDVQILRTVNVVIAAYTTAGARLELYKYLEKLGRRVLYYDTDSIIFTQKAGDWEPPTGDYLGMLTDEMAEYGPGSHIVEFVSGGPKNYSYRFWKADAQKFDTVCKVKGLTLHYTNSEKVNFNVIKKMVCKDGGDDGDIPSEVVLEDRVIVRNNTYNVFTKLSSKTYREKYTKRRRLNASYDTVPYGYRF